MSWLTTTGTAGGSFAPTENAGYFFDRLSAESVVLASGVRTVSTTAARLAIPRIVADAAVGWVAEGA